MERKPFKRQKAWAAVILKSRDKRGKWIMEVCFSRAAANDVLRMSDGDYIQPVWIVSRREK